MGWKKGNKICNITKQRQFVKKWQIMRIGISIYDPVEQSCQLLPQIPSGFEILGFSQIMCVNHKLVLLGLKHYGTSTKKILIYDFVSNTWKQGSDFHTARFMFACRASPEGSIYIVGGLEKHDPSCLLREATVYNVEKDKWELLP
ncbi:F-box/kelch-repeat protein At2g44130-like [Cryptomeria japonica]|uniref:F-box/kelch-repeat protein At2g44130-like n=1 Tax=Cryptomeria japonica TaxID=3369 RepID=UPI0027D9E4CF|nr:F-box/kelch-repeat protein At2g44130-like [Cryptomeria japonica]